jgi:16S rRNA (adenine1518-N6/adenine1519-N6)-dimethyltransferase
LPFLKANKALGQHFLRDEHIALQIVEAFTAYLHAGQVLEIGPGQGVLTKYLLEKKIDLTCVELDNRMADYLETTYPALKNKIIREDFLNLQLDKIFTGDFSIIGNFPYNISSQILFKTLERRRQIPLLVGMFQKEVAKRIASKHGNKDYGILSVLMQAYYTVEYLFDVEEGSFAPPPKVKSGVIRVIRKTTDAGIANEEFFFKFVKAAFGQRRKTLRNSLSGFIADKEKLSGEIFNLRAEQLSVQQFIELANKLAGK